MKKNWAIRKDAEAVSPVIATILMVAITVVLAAVLYVMVLGFGGTSTQTPTSSLTKSTVTGGDKFVFAPMSKDTPWSDVSILLTDGANSKTWTLLTTDLDNGTTARYNLIATVANLGTLKVNISVVDLAGNGYVNQGDYVTLTLGTGQAFANTVTYTITVMHDPSSAAICHLDFQG